MVYVQYYQRSPFNNKLIEVLGDRGVVILDGRNNLETLKMDAIKFNGIHRPIYDAFQIFKGDSFTRSKPITGIISLKEKGFIC